MNDGRRARATQVGACVSWGSALAVLVAVGCGDRSPPALWPDPPPPTLAAPIGIDDPDAAPPSAAAVAPADESDASEEPAAQPASATTDVKAGDVKAGDAKAGDAKAPAAETAGPR